MHRRVPDRADGRSHPYAGLADMEARVAGMFPSNPRPFGMPPIVREGSGRGNDRSYKMDDGSGGFGSASSSPSGGGGSEGKDAPGYWPASANNSPQHATRAVGPQKPARSGRAGNRRKQKFTRTRTGCMTCRARRIKCDEGLPVCKRCIIARKEVSAHCRIMLAPLTAGDSADVFLQCQWADEDKRRAGSGEADASRSASPESPPVNDRYKPFSRANSTHRDHNYQWVLALIVFLRFHAVS